jgi:hypothetical protein
VTAQHGDFADALGSGIVRDGSSGWLGPSARGRAAD